jgi:hypothetical protein
MDFNEFKTVLEGLPDGKGKDLLDFHVNTVENEKQVGISKVSNRNKEAERLRRYELAVKNLGYDGESDLTEFVTGLKATTETADQKDVTLTDLQKQLQKLSADFSKTQGELQTERQTAQDLKNKAKKEKIKSTLISTIGDKIYGPEGQINSLIYNGEVDLNENDEVVFKGKDDLIIPLNDGIKSFLETHQDIVKNSQKPGGGAQPVGAPNSEKSDEERLQHLRKYSGVVIPGL